MKKIVIFASGSGSNFQAIVDQLHNKVCEVSLLVCDQPDAYVLNRAESLGIPIYQPTLKSFESKVAYEAAIVDQLDRVAPDLVVLAGYMKIVDKTLLDAYEGKIINIHPSLLPAFPGKDGIGDALAYGVKVFGATVHYVDSGIDTGKIIDQEAFKRTQDMCDAEVKAKMHEIEHQLYPRVIEELLK